MFIATHLSGFGGAEAASFVPTDIAGIQGWWRADLGVTGSAPVTAWADQAGGGFGNLSEGTNGPTLNSSAVNGQPGLTFDGSNDKLATGDFTLAMPYHWFMVAKSVTWTDVEALAYGDNDAASNNPPQITQRSVSPELSAKANNVDSSRVSLALGTYGVIDAFFNTGSGIGFIRLNNGSKATGTFTSISMDGLVLGARFNDRFANCEIAEFIIYNAEITGANLTSLMSYFTARYAVP